MVFLPTGFIGHSTWKHIKEWTISMTSTIAACNSNWAGAVSTDRINHRRTEELQTPGIKHSLPVLWGAGADPWGHLNLEKIAAGQTETISDFSPPFWTQWSSWGSLLNHRHWGFLHISRSAHDKACAYFKTKRRLLENQGRRQMSRIPMQSPRRNVTSEPRDRMGPSQPCPHAFKWLLTRLHKKRA